MVGVIEAAVLHQHAISGETLDSSLGRLGTADGVAAAARFLTSDEASYVSGHILAVAGGHVTALTFAAWTALARSLDPPGLLWLALARL